jgi:predicted permease
MAESGFTNGLLQDLRHAARMARANGGVAAVAVVSLALGVGATTAIWSVLDAALLRPLAYHQPERLVRVWETFPYPGGRGRGSASVPNLRDWRRQATTLQSIGGYSWARNFNLSAGDQPERLTGATIGWEVLPILGVAPLHGRWFDPEHDAHGAEPTVVLSYGLWLDRFGGDPAIVGRDIRIDGVPTRVLAVMPAGFDFPPRSGAALWAPLRTPPELQEARDRHWFQAIARLRDGATVEAARTEMTAIAARLATEHPAEQAERGAAVETLPEAVVGRVRTMMLVLFGAVGLLLLIACGNVANLLLARATSRRQEYALRAALGASRGRLVRLVVVESLGLALVGGVLGFALGQAVMTKLKTLPGSTVPAGVELGLDGRLLAFGWGASLLAAVLSGLAPAVRTARADLQAGLRSATRQGGSARDPLRAVLVAGQVALAVLVLIGSALVLRSFVALSRTETGLRTESVLTLQVPVPQARYDTNEELRSFYDRLLARVEALPGVDAAGAIDLLPLQNWGHNGNFRVEGYEPTGVSDAPFAEFRVISTGYFEAAGIELVEGRLPRRVASPPAGGSGEPDPSADAASVAGEVLVNRRLAERHWPGQSAVGKRVGFEASDGDGNGGWLTVAGVVADVRNVGLQREISPEIYFPLDVSVSPAMSLVVRTSVDPESIAGPVRAVVRELDPDQPVAQVQTLEQVVSTYLSDSRFNALLLSLFGLLSLLLAMVGVFGFLQYVVSQRTRELGLRAALGASHGDLVRLVLRQTLVLAGSGALVGVLAASWLTRLLESQLFEVEPIDPLSFLVVVSGLVGVSLVASWVPARRAARVDPMTTLRSD